MQVTERWLHGVAVIDVAGSLTVADPRRLKDLVGKAVRRGEKRIVFNLRGLNYVDSAGLGELVACYTRATHADATIALANVDRRVRTLLEITKLLALFDVFESEEAAVGSIAVMA